MLKLASIPCIFLFLLVVDVWAVAQSDTARIRQQLTAITKTPEFRNHKNVAQLDRTAEYIKGVFASYADTTYFQEFTVEGKVYKNVICSFGSKNAKRIVLGAHYDVCGDQQGADDNASGLVGLLELARMLQGKELSNRIDLVAYTLEEPPYFRTEHMGSFVHAKSLSESGVAVLGMVSLEMIGYFSDQPRSQSYPLGILSLIYGNKGDYITLVKKFGSGAFARKFGRKFKSTKQIRTKKFVAPAKLPGIDFSDHLNYWNFGFSALMLTDTSFFRNRNYHKPTDTMETLDIVRMSKVIDGVFMAVVSL